MAPKWGPHGCQRRARLAAAMAVNPKASTRLEPIMHAYLDDLAALGSYGKGKSGVMRRFIENGVTAALEKGVIRPRNVADFPSVDGDEEDE